MADISITPSDVELIDGKTISGLVATGQTIQPGDSVAQQSDGQWALAKADDANLTNVQGISLVYATGGNRVTVATNGALVKIGGTQAFPRVLIQSANAGKIAPEADITTGWHLSVVGNTVSATELIVSITNTGIASA